MRLISESIKLSDRKFRPLAHFLFAIFHLFADLRIFRSLVILTNFSRIICVFPAAEVLLLLASLLLLSSLALLASLLLLGSLLLLTAGIPATPYCSWGLVVLVVPTASVVPTLHVVSAVDCDRPCYYLPVPGTYWHTLRGTFDGILPWHFLFFGMRTTVDT
jgi:hypothetical protein